MESIIRWYKSYIYCSLEDGDMERFFNMCKNHRIEIWDIQRNANKCMCFLYVEDFWKIRKFIRKTNVKIRIYKKSGFRFLCRQIQARKALGIGFLIFIGILCLMTSRIWCIEVYGNSYYTKDAIVKYLKTYENIDLGQNKKRIDSSKMEENLRHYFKDISWISSYIEGTSLIINIEEGTNEKSILTADKREALYSNVEGEITHMVTRSGTPVVSVGDKIKMGDLLLDGKTNIYDDSMNVVEERMVGADGDVWVKTTEYYHKQYPYSIMSKRYERSLYALSLSVGDFYKTFYLNTMKNPETSMHVTNYILQTKSCSLSLEKITPYENISALESSKDAKEMAEKELSELFSEFHEKGVQIIQNNVRMEVYGDRVEAKGSLIIIQPISTRETSVTIPVENLKNGETYEYNGNDN